MAPSPLRRIALLLLAATLLLLSVVHAEVYWDTCQSEADHPKQWEGDYYNLCIIDELFEGRAHSWKFTKAVVKETTFKNCRFENRKEAPNNFTNAVWNNVLFDGCHFGSVDIEYGPDVVFDHTVLTNVRFRNTEFDHSINLVFDNFEMINVTFENCTFKGNSIFQSGTINTLTIHNSLAVHNPAEMYVSDHNESIIFKSCTINTMTTYENRFINPVRFEGINAADISFNETSFNELHCHGPEEENGSIDLLTQFNSSTFDNCEFSGKVVCDSTSWRGFSATNITFFDDADFSKSLIYDIYWDGIHSVVPEGAELTTLNFSQSGIVRRTFANITVDGRASFEWTSFEKVHVKNFYAKHHNFDQAIFHKQEYIDGQCCTIACKPLKCRCNVTEPSGNCPTAKYPVNVSAFESECFPGDARVETADGSVANVGELTIGDRVRVSKDEFSDVYFFGHRASEPATRFVRLAYDDHSDVKVGQQASVRLSAGHYLYVNGQLQTAGSVAVGDRLRHAGSGHDDLIVTGVDSVYGKGLYAPTTMHGDLAVDGVVVSSYTQALHPSTAHRLLAPVRALYRWGLHGLVRRVTMLERSSWSGVARAIGLAEGPEVMEEGRGY